MGIRTVMITGDNAVTATAIAEEAGVDDVLAEATPEDKMALIRKEQEGGRMVAMCGDGTNDAPALAQADVGVAMNTGTTAAKEAGNMVDLDSDPTKLIDVVEIGKQLLITRGALTTFSVANDVAKYFAILPAMFVVAFPELDVLNVMRLSSPESAIVSAVVFNALIIVALIPLSLRGVRYTAGVGHGPAAPQPAGLRRRRPGRAVRRHQAARPRRLAHPRSLGETATMKDISRSAPPQPGRAARARRGDPAARRRLPAGRHRGRPGRVPVAGRRLAGHRDRRAHHRRRRRRRLGARSARSSTTTDLFQTRPSAAGDGYDMLCTYGSNLGPKNPDLVAADRGAPGRGRRARGRRPVRRAARRRHRLGLRPRPHISAAYAALQVPRVAAATGLSEAQVRDLVDEHTAGRTLGVLGEPRVNVLELNIAVRQAAGRLSRIVTMEADPPGGRRGRLTVYLGAAPGVGKTYAMLGEARRRAERGTDVVVGYVETHGRAAHRGAARGARGGAARGGHPPRRRRSPRWTPRR